MKFLSTALVAAAHFACAPAFAQDLNYCDEGNGGNVQSIPAGPETTSVNPDGTVRCDGFRLGGNPGIWRMDVTEAHPIRQLDIDIKSIHSLASPVPGTRDVELAHVVFGSGNTQTRVPIRLRRDGTEQAPLDTYVGWLSRAGGARQFILPEQTTDAGERVMSLQLHVQCGPTNCAVRIWQPASQYSAAGFASIGWVSRPAGAAVGVEFGMTAGYTYYFGDRLRRFKPYRVL